MQDLRSRGRSLRQNSSRPTIGFLTDQMVGMYQRAVWLGVSDVARELDANLLCFAGGVLRSPYGFEVQHNVLFDLASTENVDALVVMTGAIGNQLTPEGIRSFCQRYEPLPMVSVARRIEGMPSVLVDNDRGMREALAHLIEDHGHRRIAFIRGPEFNDEAERRYRVYIEMLAAYGLPLDPELVQLGNFRAESGTQAVRNLMAIRRRGFDALMAANDEMAFGALEALRAHGTRVPDDVAVIGFDDIEGSAVARPPLSTVQQPLYEQGRHAAEMVLALLDGQQVPEQMILPTKLVVRRSCGCFSQATMQAHVEHARVAISDISSAVETRREEVLGHLLSAAGARGEGPDAVGAARILDAFTVELLNERKGHFLSALDDTLRALLVTDVDVATWQGVLSALRRQFVPVLGDHPPLLTRAENLWQAARVLLGEIAQQAQAQRRLQSERRADTLRQIAGALATTFDVAELMDVLARELPRLSIGSCFLSLYQKPETPIEGANLVMAYDEAGARKVESGGMPFPTRELAPPKLLPRDRNFVYVVQPLFFKEDRFGFVLFETGPREGEVYEMLRDQISSALKGALLVQEVVRKDQELVRLLADLEHRRRELEQALNALRENQEKLLISEKMASIGRLTAGIAHEINTPLAAVRAALSELEKLVSEYDSSVGDAGVTNDDHHAIAGDMTRSLQIAGKASERVAGFVRGIKSQTRDLSPRERQRFNAVPVIQEALLLLSHALRQGKCTSEFKHQSEIVELFGSPSRLAQVVTNLVTNAIDAMSGSGGGPITLQLVRTDENVELRVSDRGCGIPPENVSRIFDPMFTTKPFGIGTGLGLTIVHDAVAGEFGGAVEVQSQVNVGTTFIIKFPFAEKAAAAAAAAAAAEAAGNQSQGS